MLGDRGLVDQVAQTVYAPPNLLGAPLLIALLGLEADEQVRIVLSFGYPARPQDPQARSPEEWIRRANRRPLEEVARHL